MRGLWRWIRRWPVIRHVRAVYWSYRVHRWAWMWGRMGIGLGHPNPADLAHLERIWKGEA